jgi:hypothetical protein
MLVQLLLDIIVNTVISQHGNRHDGHEHPTGQSNVLVLG